MQDCQDEYDTYRASEQDAVESNVGTGVQDVDEDSGEPVDDGFDATWDADFDGADWTAPVVTPALYNGWESDTSERDDNAGPDCEVGHRRLREDNGEEVMPEQNENPSSANVPVPLITK